MEQRDGAAPEAAADAAGSRSSGSGPTARESCAMMTHDVEGPAGTAFCDRLMDLDDSFGIKSAFQLVPDAHRGTVERPGRRSCAVAGLRGQPSRSEPRRAACSRTRSSSCERAAQINRVRARVPVPRLPLRRHVSRAATGTMRSISRTTCRCRTPPTSSRSAAAAAR